MYFWAGSGLVTNKGTEFVGAACSLGRSGIRQGALSEQNAGLLKSRLKKRACTGSCGRTSYEVRSAFCTSSKYARSGARFSMRCEWIRWLISAGKRLNLWRCEPSWRLQYRLAQHRTPFLQPARFSSRKYNHVLLSLVALRSRPATFKGG